MPVPSHELTRLDSNSFEHLVNALALRVLGAGLTGFAPGPDGGRDGFFEGAAPYPNSVDQWAGRWYVQSKFHLPHLSKDPQKWLLNQISKEIAAFRDPRSRRTAPDIWILATNIDPSGSAETGSFDAALALVKKWSPDIAKRFHIWGGRKILDLLSLYPEISAYYGEFITPGNVLKLLYDTMRDDSANIDDIIRHLIVTQVTEQQYTKLEQAGSTADNRPGVHELFVDVPFVHKDGNSPAMAAATLARACAQVHRDLPISSSEKNWVQWNNAPCRARTWFVKGGPGQGKSTLTQYMAQIHRAAIILASPDMPATPKQRAIADAVRTSSLKRNLWPESPRIPVLVELRDYAFWYAQKSPNASRRTLSFLADKLSNALALVVNPGTIKRAFSASRWLFVFDGLDEVPSDVKDSIAAEVCHFVDDCLVSCRSTQ